MSVTKHATITSGESLSDAVDIRHAQAIAAVIPSTWDTAGMSFEVVSGEDSIDLAKADGSEYTVTATAGMAVPLDMEVLAPFDQLRVRSGTSASAVAQSGLEGALVATLATDKTLKFTSGVGGTDANNLNITIETADDDTLAAAIDGYDLTIKLASQTANKNTATLIEDAVQALADTGSVDLTAMTVTGSTAYDAAPPVGTVATKEITVDTGKTLTFSTILKGAQYNGIDITMETNTTDDLAVSKVTGTDGILVKFATTTDTKNAAAAIEAALQAVGTTDTSAYDISGMTVAGNAGYDAAPLAGVAASKVITLDTDKTLTFTSGVVGAASNAIKITIDVNTDETDHDTLDVSAADGVITILLADTTGSNNADTAIEAAIQAIEGGTVAGIDITGMTVTGSVAYDNAPCIALGSEVTVSEVALAGGTDSIAAGVVSAVALAGGTDSIADGVVDGEFLSGGDDCIVKLIIKE